MNDSTDPLVDIDRETGATLLGDHLVEGSDLLEQPQQSVLTDVVRRIAASTSPDRVLIVGPVSARFIGALPEHARADVLMRHLDDVRTFVERHADRTDDSYVCGGFELFTSDTRYDLVVLLGGGPTVLSPVTDGMSEQAVLDKAAGLLSERGVLLHSAQNALGLNDLLGLAPEVLPEDDRQWFVGKSNLSQRPWVRAELDAAVDKSGLHTVARLAGYPSAHAPQLLVDEACDSDAVRARVRHELPRVFSQYFSDRPAAREPGPVVRLVLADHIGPHLAPVWFTVLAKQPQEIDLPALAISESATSVEWARMTTFDASGSPTVTWGNGAERPAERSVLGVSRKLTAGAEADGSLFEDLLREAAAGGDHPQLRRLVRAYHEWLRPLSGGGPLQSITGLSGMAHAVTQDRHRGTETENEAGAREETLDVDGPLTGDADAAELGLGFDPVLAEDDVDPEIMDSSADHQSSWNVPQAPSESPSDDSGEDGAMTGLSRRAWFATPDNVDMATDGTLRIIDDSWAITNGTAAQLAFVHGLRVFATRLLAAGAPHPWRVPVTPETMLRSLAAMAGVTVTDADIEMVAIIETEVAMATGSEQGGRAELLRRNVTDGARENHLPAATDTGFRELLAQVRSLSQVTRAQSRQIAWLEGTLKMRDRRIKEYDRLMFKLEESLSYKAMRAVGAPKRAVVSKARNRVESALPPGAKQRVKQAVERAMNPDAKK